MTHFDLIFIQIYFCTLHCTRKGKCDFFKFNLEMAFTLMRIDSHAIRTSKSLQIFVAFFYGKKCVQHNVFKFLNGGTLLFVNSFH